MVLDDDKVVINRDMLAIRAIQRQSKNWERELDKTKHKKLNKISKEQELRNFNLICIH